MTPKPLPKETGSPPRTALLRYMEWWSEENWSAGWIERCEHLMARDDTDAFPWLVEQAGGWWSWREDRLVFIEGRLADLQQEASDPERRPAADIVVERDLYRKALEDIYGWKAGYPLHDAGMAQEFAEERARKALFDGE